ncbi:putative odorant-binding protein A5 [Epargyreus clarus]|uniref:putative odorant-binding protein A5 n=1 Tax=Epargyreus clarus TaxID=520877 RepID=UPI003C2C100E
MKLLLLAILAVVRSGKTQDEENVGAHFKKIGIIPDVIEEAPRDPAVVEFNRGDRARLGNELPASKVKIVPDITYRPSPYDDNYCVLILGVNNTENANCPKGTQYIYGCWQNIIGGDVFGVNPTVSYEDNPPTNGIVVFLVLEQSRRRNFKPIEKRTCFNTKQFMQDNNLFIYAGNDIKVVPK